TFVNAIFLYDDKIDIVLNYDKGTSTITFDELNTCLKGTTGGSNLDCLGAPNKRESLRVSLLFGISYL
ncbi:MAG: recombinase family protein, partial [Firmicutes bacterium]|nr:recombinase family protein [Bacillota bacterium]